MCGIVGQIGPQACDESQLLRMMSMLTHRGPDEAGLLLAEGVSFGHLRLSIVDLRTGQQPMTSYDGQYWVVFNGEIFNHLELRQELEALGHVFATRSDTEVLLNGYRQWGVDCLNRFNGQWAFALWDRTDESFFLARDRWGVRPLFYSSLSNGKTLIFASELKAILADSRVSCHWDLKALQDIFICWICESDRTPLQSVRQLLPGCYMRFKNGRCDVHRWWEVDYRTDLVEWDRSEMSWCEEVRSTLAEACRIRLRADVPVGAYLSGGLDSSIISSLTRTCHPDDFRTFSIAFADSVHDESPYQQLMAAYLGTNHRSLRITHESIVNSFEQVIWHAETPIYRTAPAPMLHLSRLVRDSGMKVVLTGEGSDELFGGYDQFKEDKVRRFWARSPDSRWRKRLLDRLGANIPNANLRTRGFWYAFYQKDLYKTEHAAYSHYIRWRNGMSLLPLLSHYPPVADCAEGTEIEMKRSPFKMDQWIEELESNVPYGFDRWHALSKAQYWETRQYLSGYLLSSQGDRMAMANSVEGRYPFLDVNVYEMARRMPPNLKLSALIEKFILRKAFHKDLPPVVVQRNKQPYRSPDAPALNDPLLRQKLIDSLSPEGTKRRGLFNPQAIAKLLVRIEKSSQPSARDNMALVLVYSSHIFHDLFVEGKMTPRTLPLVKTYVNLIPAKARYN